MPGGHETAARSRTARTWPRPGSGYDVAAYCQAARARLHRPPGAAVARALPRLRRLVHRAAGARRHRCHGRPRSTAVDGGSGWRCRAPQPLSARQVVIATGVLPYAVHARPSCRACPPTWSTHTADHHDLSRFRGRRVAVVGGGQSALETAALLHEAGRRGPGHHAPPGGQLARRPTRARQPAGEHPAAGEQALRRLALRLLELPGGVPAAATGHADHQGPHRARAGRVLVAEGPGRRGDRGADRAPVRRRSPAASGVRLRLDGPQQQAVDVDHVIAGTGFRIDIGRLPFLPEALRSRIATLNGYPVVSRAGESSVPGCTSPGRPPPSAWGRPSGSSRAPTPASASWPARWPAGPSWRPPTGRETTPAWLQRADQHADHHARRIGAVLPVVRHPGLLHHAVARAEDHLGAAHDQGDLPAQHGDVVQGGGRVRFLETLVPPASQLAVTGRRLALALAVAARRDLDDPEARPARRRLQRPLARRQYPRPWRSAATGPLTHSSVVV